MKSTSKQCRESELVRKALPAYKKGKEGLSGQEDQKRGDREKIKWHDKWAGIGGGSEKKSIRDLASP